MSEEDGHLFFLFVLHGMAERVGRDEGLEVVDNKEIVAIPVTGWPMGFRSFFCINE